MADCSLVVWLSLNLLSNMLYNVIKIMFWAKFDVLAVFVAPCCVARRRAPHVTDPGNLVASVLITKMQCSFENIAPMRALTQIVRQSLQDRRKV